MKINEATIKGSDGKDVTIKYNQDGPIGYLTVEEYANKQNKSTRQIRRYLNQDRMEGAIRFGAAGTWYIPEDAPYPEPRARGKKWREDAEEDHWINPEE